MLLIRKSLVLICLLAGISLSVQAQTFFRSTGTGTWNVLSTWQSSADSVTWVSATSIPGTTAGGANPRVFIRSGHNVTHDLVFNNNPNSVIVESGGTLTLNTTNFTSAGKVVVFGIFNDQNLNGANVFNGLVTIASGGTWNNTSNSAHTFNGGITNNGTFTSGSGQHTFASNQTLSGSTGFSFSCTVFISNNVSLTSTTSVTIQATSGTTINGGNASSTWINGAGSTLTYLNSNTSLLVTGAINASANSNTVNYNVDGNTVIKAGNYFNLNLGGTLTASRNRTLSGAINVANNLSIAGTSSTFTNTISSTQNIVISTGATLNINSFGILQLGTGGFTNNGTTNIAANGLLDDNNNTGTNIFVGLITNNGTWTSSGNSAYQIRGGITNNGTFTAGTGVYTLNTNAQTLQGTNALTFANLTIGQVADPSLLVYTIGGSNNLTVTSNLVFSKGIITTGSNSLIYTGTAATSASSTNGWVNGNLSRSFAVATNISRAFDIGTALVYSPITITFPNVTTTGSLVVRTVSSDHPNIGSACLSSTFSVNRYWSITNAGIIPLSYNAVVNYVSGDVDASVNTANYISGLYNGTTWSFPGIASQTATSATINGITAAGDIQIAERLLAAPSAISGTANVCSTTSGVAYSISSIAGATGYIWTLPTGASIASGANSNSITVNFATPSTSGNMTVQAISPSCSSSVSTPLFINTAINNNTISTDQSICTSETVQNALTGTAVNGGSGTYTYLWESSTTSSTAGFTTASGTTNGVNYTVGARTATTWFRRVVSSAGGCSNISNATQISVYSTPPGNPSVFGNGHWINYCYSSTGFNNLGTYYGFYNESNLSFDTRTRWVDGTRPSNASGYLGCLVPATNIGMSMKRTNIPNGVYQISVPAHDDGFIILVNGVNVYQNAGCCANRGIVWTGALTTSSLVEIQWFQGGGGGYLQMNFTLVPSPIIALPGVIAGNQSVCSGQSPSTLTSISAATAGTCTAFPTPYQWQSSTDSLNWVNISGATATTLSPAAITQTTFYRRVYSDYCNVVVSNVVKAKVSNASAGLPVTFGTSAWNSYVFNNVDFTSNYAGFFTVSDLNVDTDPNIFAANSRPSLATNYDGCLANTSPYSIRFLRTNLNAGNYRITINRNDDNVTVLNNGVSLFSRGASGTAVTAYTGFFASNAQLEVRLINNGGSGDIDFTVVPYTPSALLPGTISGSQAVCSNEQPLIALSSITPFTTDCNFITYQWQLSFDSTNWVDISGATAASYTIPSAVNLTTWYRRGVTDACNRTAFTTPVKVSIDNTVYGDPSVFGNNVWNVYSYKDNNFSVYGGLYTEPLLTFATTNRYTTTQSPNFASDYRGCTIPITNYSTSMKRTGFATGIYQIDVSNLDDVGTLLINGVQVFTAGCCSPATNIWTGPLNSSSLIEWRWTNFGGPGRSGLTFTLVTPTPLGGGVIGSSSTICRGDIPPLLSNVTSPTNGCYVLNYTWQTSTNAGATWTNLSSSNSITYTPTQTVFVDTWFRRVAVDVCGNTAISNTVIFTINNTPPGNPANFGANEWNINVYDDQSFGLYIGYFTDTTLSFNTQSRYCTNCAPSIAGVSSSGTAYNGCQNVSTFYSVILKRRGVPSNKVGYYRIDIPQHDDDVYLFINGVNVYQHIGCCDAHTNVWTGYLDVNSTIEFRYVNYPGPGYLRMAFNYLGTTPPGALVAGDISNSPSNYCNGDLPRITSLTPASGGCYPIYKWQQSSDGVTWSYIFGATTEDYNATAPIIADTYFRREVSDNCGNAAVYTSPVLITINNTTPGDPSIFGNNQWNAYVYNSNNFTNYSGFYVEPLLSFSTTDRFAQSSIPSFASGYQGCQTNGTQYSIIFKRTNITPGIYQIDIPYHDDNVFVYVNGVLVYQFLGCCAARNNVWTGSLNASSEVELRYINFNGPGQLQASFTLVTPAGLTSAGSIGSGQNVCFGAIPATLTNATDAVSGCYIYYQWQQDNGSGFVNIPNATGASYTFTSGLTTTTTFRRVASDGCNNTPINSNLVTITVFPQINPGTIGNDQTICTNTSTAINSITTASGGNPPYTYQWQSSTNNITFTNVPSAGTSVSYTTPNLVANTFYRRNANSACGTSLSSNSVLVTISPTTSITTQPANYSVCAGGNAIYSITAVGTGLTYRWQVDNNVTGFLNISDNAQYSGSTTPTLNILGVTAGMNNFRYRCVVNATCLPTSINSNSANLIIGGPTITTNPSSVAVCNNGSTTFSAAATGNPLTYQWQVSSNGGTTWSDILTEAGIYSNFTTPVLSVSNITTALTTFQYRCVITSSCGSSTTTGGILTVNTSVSNNSITADQTICPGVPATLNGSTPTGGGGGYIYQWQNSTDNISFSNITGATAINHSPVSISQTTFYRRQVSTALCSSALASTSNVVTVTINTGVNITTQPTSVAICPTGTATFSAAGTNATAFQWQQRIGAGPFVNITNGGVYSGATTSTLTITSPGATFNGYLYRCVVSATSCSSTTNNATLTINALPAITTQPVNVSSCASGPTVTFSTVATGAGLTYQWQGDFGGGFNNLANVGSNFRNVTTATMTILAPPISYNGYSFRVIVSGSCSPSVTSSAANLTLTPVIAANSISSAQTICQGNTPADLVGSTPTGGTGTFTYVWQSSTTSNNSGFVTATGISNTIGYIPPVLNTTTWYRRVVNSGACNTSNSNVIQITVNPPTTIVTQPANANTCAGSNAFISVSAVGSSLSYKWQEKIGSAYVDITNGVQYPGFTTSTLTISSPTALMNGNKYRVIVSGNCVPSDVTSDSAQLFIDPSPVITSQPVASNVCEGTISTFNVVASGSPLTYRWQRRIGTNPFVNISDDAIFSGTTTATLTINNTPIAYSGDQFRCVVNQVACAVNSNAGTITVQARPTITSHPTSLSRCIGSTASFTATASGAGLTYQWFGNIPTNTQLTNTGIYSNTTTNTLNISSVTNGINGYSYALRVSGSCSPAVFTNYAPILVNPNGLWLGTSGNSWQTAANWCGGIPTLTTDVTINAGTPNNPTIFGTSNAKDILINPGASLSISGANTLNVSGVWTNNNIFNPGPLSTVAFNSATLSQAIAGNAKTTFNNLSITNGSLEGVDFNADLDITGTFTIGANTKVSNVGRTVRLMSTSTGTARLAIVPSTSSYVGNLTMQRFLPAKRLPRYISAPVQGTTLARLMDSVRVYGPTANGFDAPNVTSTTFKIYQEEAGNIKDRKWNSIPSPAFQLQQGTGYYLLASVKRNGSTLSTNPVTLQLTGPPNIGNINLPVTFTSSAPDPGWNFVGNPYPSQIDWNSGGWTKTNIDNAFYTWDPQISGPGGYYTFNNGIGVPTRANPSVIASFQGFFVKANAANPVLSVTENVKVATAHTSNFRTSEPTDLLRLSFAKDTIADETVVYFDNDATSNFDGDFDSYKFTNTQINLSTRLKDGTSLAINGLGNNQDTISIPLVLSSTLKGLHILGVKSNSVEQTLYLEDKLLNTIAPIDQSTQVALDFASATTLKDRFVIRNYLRNAGVTNLVDLNPKLPVVSIYPNPSIVDYVDVDIIDLKDQTFTIDITDINGKLMFTKEFLAQSGSNHVKRRIDAVKNLAAGIYVMKVYSKSINSLFKISVIK